jgi:hypothetical protein
MAAAELTACHVEEDLTFPAPMEGYLLTSVAFYELGFSAPIDVGIN